MRKRQTPVLEAPALVQPAQLQLLAIPEVARILCIGRTKVYSLIKTDGLPTVKVGSATRVSVVALQRWIEQHERAS